MSERCLGLQSGGPQGTVDEADHWAMMVGMVYVWGVLAFVFLSAAGAAGLLHFRRGWSRPASIAYLVTCAALGGFFIHLATQQ